jgi:hypothetical protein
MITNPEFIFRKHIPLDFGYVKDILHLGIRWFFLGKVKYKYNICCVLYFIFSTKIYTREYIFITNKDGFVPCPRCAKKLLKQHGLEPTILKELPYPVRFGF